MRVERRRKAIRSASTTAGTPHPSTSKHLASKLKLVSRLLITGNRAKRNRL